MLPARTRFASPSAARLIPARVHANRPVGPSFKAASASLSSRAPSGRGDSGGAVHRGAVASRSGGALLAVGGAIAAAPWRERGRSGPPAAGIWLVFPSLGVAAAILGVAILIEREPLAGNALLLLAAILLAAAPLAAVPKILEGQRRGAVRERAPVEAGRISQRLLDAGEPSEVADPALDELAEPSSSTWRTSRWTRTTDGPPSSSPPVRPARITRPPRRADRARPRTLRDQRGRPRRDGVRGLRRRELGGREPAAERDREGEELRLHPRPGAGERDRRRLRRRPAPAPVRGRGARADAVVCEREAGLALERLRATAALGEALERERLIAQISLQLRSRRATRSSPRCSRRSAGP